MRLWEEREAQMQNIVKNRDWKICAALMQRYIQIRFKFDGCLCPCGWRQRAGALQPGWRQCN